MDLDITHSDIGSELCRRCAACCRIQLCLPGTGSRYRKFLRQLGYSVYPSPKEGKADCCDDQHDITLDMGFCKHIEITVRDGVTLYGCKLYGTEDYPDLCDAFDCVSWAKHADAYKDSNTTLVAAQTALNLLRSECDQIGASKS